MAAVCGVQSRRSRKNVSFSGDTAWVECAQGLHKRSLMPLPRTHSLPFSTSVPILTSGASSAFTGTEWPAARVGMTKLASTDNQVCRLRHWNGTWCGTRVPSIGAVKQPQNSSCAKGETRHLHIIPSGTRHRRSAGGAGGKSVRGAMSPCNAPILGEAITRNYRQGIIGVCGSDHRSTQVTNQA